MKKYLAICTLVVLCFSAAGRSGEKPLRLLYWNIQNGMWSGQEDNYDAFVGWVKEKKPDICVWCEAQSIYYTGTDKRLPAEERYLVDNWKTIARRYGHKYVYVGAHPDSYPQVITARYPIRNVVRITGEAPDSLVVHGAGWARITLRGKTLNIVTMHGYPMSYDYRVKNAGESARKESSARHEGDAYRRMEIEKICSSTILTDPDASGRFWMMMGDFNSLSRADNCFYSFPEDDTRFLVHDYVRDNTPYVDVVHEMNPRSFLASAQSCKRIDLVYATPALMAKVKEARIVEDRYTTPVRSKTVHSFFHPSDHLPILIDFVL